MMRAPVFNVAGSSPHGNEDVHPSGYGRRKATHDATNAQAGMPAPPGTDETS